MSSDGANQGVSAGRALKTILGGDPAPTEDEGRDAAAMLDWIRTAPPPPFIPEDNDEDDAYSNAARWCAHLILDWVLADPRRAQGPSENVYERNADGSPVIVNNGLVLVSLGWYERMKADGIDLATLGLTGFMWGWAVNAVRYVTELPPVPNPALIEVSVGDIADSLGDFA